MANYSWCAKTPPVPNPQDVVLAFYSGMPLCPYTPKQVTAFSIMLTRGRRARAFSFHMSGGEIKFAEFPTHLTVTVRPTPSQELEWSFSYEVGWMGETLNSGQAEVAARVGKMSDFLKAEVDAFVEYCLGFAK